MDDIRVYGPPGTGKTLWGVRAVAEHVRATGVDPAGIGYCSFTTAATREAADRLGRELDVGDWALPFVATLHALCLRGLCLPVREWNAERKLREFAARGWDVGGSRRHFTEDGVEATETGTDDPLLGLVHWGRHRLLPGPAETFAAFVRAHRGDDGGLDPARFAGIWGDYVAWKEESGLLDFTDVLEQAVEAECVVPATVALLDEAQDQSPLLWRAWDVLFRDCPRRIVVGDDDQAIFAFQGADAAAFNARPVAHEWALRQSHRLPAAVNAVAQRLISRVSARRVKAVLPVTRESLDAQGRYPDLLGEVGRCGSLEALPYHPGESHLVLARNWAHLSPAAAWLESAGIPYRVLGDAYSPWDDKHPVRAARAVRALQEGQEIPVEWLQSLVEKTASARGSTPGMWQWGAKKGLAEKLGAVSRVGLRDLVALGMTEWGAERVLNGDLTVLTGISVRDFSAYQAALRYGRFDEPVGVSLSTIHGAKGREADNVAVIGSATGRARRSVDAGGAALEDELRLAYVAVTRARRRVVLVSDPMLGAEWGVFGGWDR